METSEKIKVWILSEERPKPEVLKKIIEIYCQNKGFTLTADISAVNVLPIFTDHKFDSVYRITGVEINEASEVLLKIVSGYSSFVDFLIYETVNDLPTPAQNPTLIIEETKTADTESRNTGIFQRASKFVYVDNYYPAVKKIMFYNLRVEEQKTPTATNSFGTRLLLTIGVELTGKKTESTLTPFSTLDELITARGAIRKPPKGNVPISITQTDHSISISGRLFKNGSLSHDPNIGALTLIAKALRTLGWKHKIIITQHGLDQTHIKQSNKFVLIANLLDLELEGLTLPKIEMPKEYWKFEQNSEKLASILLHILSLQTSNIVPIYENHAGSERGYLYDSQNGPIVIGKYIGNKKIKGIINIPDLVLRDDENKIIYSLEGKISAKVKDAISDLKNYGPFEDEYLKIHYPEYEVRRGVVLYGENVVNPDVLFTLNSKGEVFLQNKIKAVFLNEIQAVIDQLSN